MATVFSKLKVFEKGVSVKDLQKQLVFLVWKLACNSCSSRPDPPKRPFTPDENVPLLALAAGLNISLEEFLEFAAQSNRWKGSIDLAGVAELLSTSPLWGGEEVPIGEVKEAVDFIKGVLGPTAMEHLVRTSGSTASGLSMTDRRIANPNDRAQTTFPRKPPTRDG